MPRGIVLVVLAWSSVALAGGKKEKLACAEARTADTVEAWSAYLDAWPTGTCSPFGRDRLAELRRDREQCEAARAAGGVDLWRTYSFTWPTGECAEEAAAFLAEARRAKKAAEAAAKAAKAEVTTSEAAEPQPVSAEEPAAESAKQDGAAPE